MLTQGVGDGGTCHSGYGVVETDQVFFQEAGVVWWQSLGESPRWEALVCSQRREKAGKAKVDDGFRRFQQSTWVEVKLQPDFVMV